MTSLNPRDYHIPEPFEHYAGDTAEDFGGPFFYHREGDQCHSAFRVQAHHCNMSGTTHGGFLMMFADYCLCMAALTDDMQTVLTVNCNNDFLGPSKVGDLILGQSVVTRRGRSLAFARCQLQVDDQVILTASGVIKQIWR